MLTCVLRCIAGVPPHAAYQNAKRKVVKAKTAGVQLETFLDLQRWAAENYLPADREAMEPFKVYAVPLDWTKYLGVEAVALTLHVQVGWIQTLVNNPHKFVLHVDGKHKLHHGSWILVTVGTHSVERDEHQNSSRGQIVHSFRPLVYMFCKQHESAESITFLLDALNWCCTIPTPTRPSSQPPRPAWPEDLDLVSYNIDTVLMHISKKDDVS